jgi:EAL domain-containing protein (putative c-di-GMP-specific phosphodiesterase class I)
MVDVGDTWPGSGVEGGELEWSSRIGEALRRDLFVLHGQRIVDVVSGLTLRHELFPRMVDRKRLIPAGEFVAAAEQSGSIREIDRWVVGKAIEIAARGHAVDVNLSVRAAHDEMLDRIRGGLEETGARARDLVLELSEKQLVREVESGGEFVHAASDLGCRIALDRFVTGGKGAFLLKRFPIDFVKLGPPFIGDLSVGRAKRRKVNGAVLKAHRHGQRVIAQGVEDLVTLELMQDLAIDEAQGYALGPPESVDSMLGATV